MNSLLLGFVVGATLGAASVAVQARRGGPNLRQTLRDRWNGAVEVAKQVAAQREKEMWAEWRAQLPAGQQNRPQAAGPHTVTVYKPDGTSETQPYTEA